MTKHLLLCFLLFSNSLFSQEVENASFEEWEETTGPNDEPVDWSSIQTGEPDNLANFAPQVLFQSDEAYSGDHSIHLKNHYVSLADEVANGLATNGRVHLDLDADNGDVHTDTSDPKWYTECLTRPDSVAGYFKYIPQGEDVTTVQALLHTGDIGIIPDPDSTGWIGMATFTSLNEETDGWIRFAAAFEYFDEGNPEYVLFNISSGDGVNAVEDSEAWYDDIELVYNPVGINEEFANSLLSVYASQHNIIIDMTKFTAGEHFSLSIFNVSGQLIIEKDIISGYRSQQSIDEAGIYICRIMNEKGLQMSKKVVIR